MPKKNIFLWILYDFANSIVVIIFFLYLSQWMVLEAGISSFWYNAIFVGSSILLFLSAPKVAAISDKIKRRKIFLNISTIGTFLFLALSSLFAARGISYGPLVAIFYLLSQYFYQFSFVFYNPMLEELAPSEKRGKISGLGQTANWLGQIAGILLALPLASHGRIAPLLPSVIIFFILSLPMMIWFKEKGPENSSFEENENRAKNFFRGFYYFLRFTPAGLFIISFFFFNDAILTLENNFAIYVDRVFHTSDSTKSVLLIIILVTSAIGAYLSGWMGDKFGLKKMIKIILISWIIILPLTAASPSLLIFSIMTGIIGLFYGSVWSVTRAYLSCILPPKEMNYGFSFYTIAERFASFAGPLTWGLIITGFGQSSSLGYRLAALSMTIFVIIGYLFMRKAPDPGPKIPESATI